MYYLFLNALIDEAPNMWGKQTRTGECQNKRKGDLWVNKRSENHEYLLMATHPYEETITRLLSRLCIACTHNIMLMYVQ